MDSDKYEISDEMLNMFVDGELAEEEADEIHAQLLNDADVRERVCQIRAVRELIGYAYHHVPHQKFERRRSGIGFQKYVSMVAAALLLCFAAMLGWYGHHYSDDALSASRIKADEVFDYLSKEASVQPTSRKIVVHVTTGDLLVLKNVLDETQRLMNSYQDAGESLSIDVVTYKSGINLLREGVTPFAERIALMSENNHVRFYACARSIQKATKEEGNNIVMLPNVKTDKMARELIPERIAKGWVYIKV